MITTKVDGSVLCHGREKTWPDKQSFDREREELLWAAGASKLSKAAFDHSGDALRDELAKKLYKAAEKETNRERKNAIEKFAQAIDAGTLPIPRDLHRYRCAFNGRPGVISVAWAREPDSRRRLQDFLLTYS